MSSPVHNDDIETEVIELIRHAEGSEPPITVKHFVTRGCSHPFVVVNETDRSVRCKRCQELVDPVMLLIRIGKEWQKTQSNMQHLKHEIERRKKVLEGMKREEKNAKARLRRQKVRNT